MSCGEIVNRNLEHCSDMTYNILPASIHKLHMWCGGCRPPRIRDAVTDKPWCQSSLHDKKKVPKDPPPEEGWRSGGCCSYSERPRGRDLRPHNKKKLLRCFSLHSPEFQVPSTLVIIALLLVRFNFFFCLSCRPPPPPPPSASSSLSKPEGLICGDEGERRMGKTGTFMAELGAISPPVCSALFYLLSVLICSDSFTVYQIHPGSWGMTARRHSAPLTSDLRRYGTRARPGAWG